jgi:hypothetical protein
MNIVVKKFELKETLLVHYFNSILFNKLYKNITYTSTFFPARTSYRDGFPRHHWSSYISSIYNSRADPIEILFTPILVKVKPSTTLTSIA